MHPKEKVSKAVYLSRFSAPIQVAPLQLFIALILETKVAISIYEVLDYHLVLTTQMGLVMKSVKIPASEAASMLEPKGWCTTS